ncbi:MAG: MarR family transcriptional regulator [Candidatus Tumulicola sp.]
MDQIDRIVKQWRRERPDVDPEPMALIGRLQRVVQALRPALDATHGEFGLSGDLFDVLAALRRSGKPYQLTPTDLYREMMLSSGAMTNRIDRLEREGLVQRKADPGDRRGTLVSLTSKGQALIDRALLGHVANERRLLGTLDAKERAQLATLLRKLLAGIERDSR